ncbi:hypothetical protein GCM10022377_12300 [Zhihengliuella alba]|uniref:DUF4439 domain-containing protein n=1 Tax=Zhihengliuella alba TaxID=547018 RepID=A0ABP7D4A8_9MICC
MSQRPSPPRSAPSGRGRAHDGAPRPPRSARLKRGLRQLTVFAILALIIVALGTTAITGGARDPEQAADPSVEQHVAALAAGAAALGGELPATLRESVSRQSRLLGPPQTTEPLFSWLPESDPREPVIPPADDVAGFADQLEATARLILQTALRAPLDPATGPEGGQEDGHEGGRDEGHGAVAPERLRTLVAVGLEQIQALETLDAERAEALRAEVGAAALESASAPSTAAPSTAAPSAAAPSVAGSSPDAPDRASDDAASPTAGTDAGQTGGAGRESAETGSAAPEATHSDAEAPSGAASPSREAPEPVAGERCAPVAAAADAAYRTAYLYEYGAVRSQVDWPDQGVVGDPSTGAEESAAGLGEPLAASPVADPAAWWPTADRREALGDRLADLLPQGCVAVREPAYAAPADPELPDALAETEVQLALALRDAAAAAPVSQRGWLLVEALAATARATEEPWLTLTAEG